MYQLLHKHTFETKLKTFENYKYFKNILFFFDKNQHGNSLKIKHVVSICTLDLRK